MKTAVYYCHACLDDMGMEPGVMVDSVKGDCPCCHQETVLFSMSTYQRAAASYARGYKPRRPADAMPAGLARVSDR